MIIKRTEYGTDILFLIEIQVCTKCLSYVLREEIFFSMLLSRSRRSLYIMISIICSSRFYKTLLDYITSLITILITL